jgi:PLP dependent protein
MSEIQQRIDAVRREIEAAAQRSGRDPAQIQLVAVSKHQPASAIREAYACGLRDFGENYVQELVSKAQELEDLPDLRWHLVGHLQTNKAKSVAQIAHYVHTIDNARITTELSNRAGQEHQRVGVFVEINIAQEPQKSGCLPLDAASLVERVKVAPNLVFVGLMTVGQRVESPEAARTTFVQLRQLRDMVAPGAALSMGMSADYAVAIEEGATCVRVGTAIFGERS